MPATGDPLLKTAGWLAVRAYWIAQRGPCGRCGGAIDYDYPVRYWASLDVGHIVGRDQARLLGWTAAQINDLSNTQPEHSRCNRRGGARYGNAKRGRIRAVLKTTRAW